jgi:hypothetical protein
MCETRFKTEDLANDALLKENKKMESLICPCIKGRCISCCCISFHKGYVLKTYSEVEQHYIPNSFDIRLPYCMSPLVTGNITMDNNNV